MRWTYKTVEINRSIWSGKMPADKLAERLSVEGADGWELVAAIEKWANASRAVLLIFKRSASDS